MEDQVNVHHMNGGQGENSYYNNSLYQKKVILEAKPKLEQNVAELCSKSLADSDSLTMVDMGCSSGPNTLLPLWEIIETIDSTCNKKTPALQYFLNDLQENDFNTIFKSLLPDFHRKLKKEKGDKFKSLKCRGSFYF